MTALIEPDLDPPVVEAEHSSTTPPPSPEPPSIAGTSRPRKVAAAAAWSLVGIGLVIVAWAVAAARNPDLPTPAATASEMRELLSSPFHDNGPNDLGIGRQLLGSLGRVAWGFGLAALVGVPLGLAMGTSRRVWQAINPVVQLLRPVSPLAWFPIWLVLFKDAPRAAVWVILITALWPIVLNTAAGAAAVPADQRNVAKVFRFSRAAYVRHILVPHSMSSIITGLRLAMGTAWMVIVAVEMLSGGTGIGFFVWDAYNALNLSRVVCAILLIGMIGVAIDLAFLQLARRYETEEVGS